MATCPQGHPTQNTDYCDVCGAPVASAPAAAPAMTPAAPAPQPQTCPNCDSPNPADALFCEACGYDFTTGTKPRAASAAADLLSLDTPAPTPPAEPAMAEPVPAPGATPLPEPEPEPAPEPETVGEPIQPALVTDEVAVPAATPAPAVLLTDEPAPATPAAQPASPAAPVTWVAEVWVDPEWFDVQGAQEAMPSPGLPTVVPLPATSALIGRTSTSRNVHPDIDCGTDSGCSRRQAMLTTDGQRWFVEDLGSANGTYVGVNGAPLPEQPITARTELVEDARIYVGAWTRIVLRRATPDERAAFAG